MYRAEAPGNRPVVAAAMRVPFAWFDVPLSSAMHELSMEGLEAARSSTFLLLTISFMFHESPLRYCRANHSQHEGKGIISPVFASRVVCVGHARYSLLFHKPNQSVEELTNAGIKMAEINKLKEANLATVGSVLASPTKARLPSCIAALHLFSSSGA